MNRIYLCIDLKSFYASVECVARELDPLTTNLVVADKERTDKTICLAVTPSLKAYGISGRARLFEVVQRVEEINRYRRSKAPGRKLDGESYDDPELKRNPSLALSYIVAPPRMSYYMETSARIYDVYLKFIAPEDIHVYSIDEVFIDLTPYLKTYQKTPREMAEMLIKEVLTTTGITATAGIGTNMYLAKVAMDITAKKMPADENGVRIAELDEMSYRRELWTHRPLTDFWMVGRGISKKLEDKYHVPRRRDAPEHLHRHCPGGIQGNLPEPTTLHRQKNGAWRLCRQQCSLRFPPRKQAACGIPSGS